MIVEIACFNLKSALIAAEHGADRIEYCRDYSSGGMTPFLEDFTELRKKVKLPIFVMLHPRKGPYQYSLKEFDMVKNQLETYKRAGADGFVFACMYNEQEINITKNKELISMANPLPCTFHRAFDIIENKDAAVEDIIKCGFKRILTSGGTDNHINELVRLQKKFGKSITFIPAGGIRSGNVQEYLTENAFSEIHSSGILEGEIANKNEITQLASKVK